MRYKAFISYSHADARWAKWIQRALELLLKTQGICEQMFEPGHPRFESLQELLAIART